MSKINYPLERIKAFVFDIDGVLSPVTVPLGDDGLPRRMANMRDGYAMKHAAREGYKIAIISGAKAPGITERFRAININDVYLGVGRKIDTLKEWMAANGLEPSEVAFAGDDIPDISSMKAVGLSVAPADGCREAKVSAVYISPVAGGYGVARDLIEEVCRAQGKWADDAPAFG